jgi:hypothetical protein
MPQNFEAYASKLEACLKKRPKKKEAKVRGPLLIGGSSNPFPGGYLGVLFGRKSIKTHFYPFTPIQVESTITTTSRSHAAIIIFRMKFD